MTWRPRPLEGVDVTALQLSALDGFVLARLDGATDAAALAQVTGLPAARLGEILARLVRVGAVAGDAGPGAGQAPGPGKGPAAGPGAGQAEKRLREEEATHPEEALPAPEAEAALEDDAEEPAANEGTPSADDGEEGATLRARFELALKGLEVDERVQRAQMADEPDLSALCFDPTARVIKALVHNPRFGLAHARLVARHHRNAQGLEALCVNAAFTADDVVRRELLKNPQLQSGTIRRLWANRRMLEQWRWSVSREVTEQAKRTLREALRTRFASGAPEERVELIFKTEGRALLALSGLPIDAKTTAMLCGRTYSSSMLVQNLARWGPAPPPLISHLLRQALVQRQPPLRAMLMAHPNSPRGLSKD